MEENGTKKIDSKIFICENENDYHDRSRELLSRIELIICTLKE